MPKVTLTLTDEEAAALKDWAKQECRYPNDQAKFVVLEKLRELSKVTARTDVEPGEPGSAQDGV